METIKNDETKQVAVIMTYKEAEILYQTLMKIGWAGSTHAETYDSFCCAVDGLGDPNINFQWVPANVPALSKLVDTNV